MCLDEDVPEAELSITSCAHVFHSTCIKEVAEHMGSCPVCRHSLDPSKDITPLAVELAEADATAARRPGSGAGAGSGSGAAGTAGTAGGRGRARGGGARGIKSKEIAPAAGDAELALCSGSKLAAIARRLREIGGRGEKAIVFCQWEDLKCRVSEALSAFGVRHFQLGGSVYQRGDVLRRFQEEQGPDSVPVLLLSLEHSASGTNLTAANHVIFVHPMCASSADRAVAYEAQAIGRCRRWGQEHAEVHCWRFVVRGTVEEAITAEHCRDLWECHLRTNGALIASPGLGGR